ncbi:unnamed protein product [Boreogadus saida]
MKKHMRYQASEDPQCSERQREEEEKEEVYGKNEEQRRRAIDGVVDIKKPSLMEMNQEELADTMGGPQKVFSTEEKDSVMEEQRSRADRARCLIDMVISKGKRSSQMMIDSMKKRDKQLCINMGLISSPAGVGLLIGCLEAEGGAGLT